MSAKLSPSEKASRARERRNTRIYKMYFDRGLSTRQIAEKIGLSKTRVHEIVAYE